MTTTEYVLNTLEYHKNLTEKVLDNLKSKSSTNTETIHSMYGKRILAEINEEIQKVHRLELRVTVVASMKSGKSTFINALIGDDILPVRAHAMTIMPTEVVFKRQVEEPTLFLSKEIIDAITVIARDIHSCLAVKEASEEQKNELFENEPHLNSIVEEMLDSNYSAILEKEVVGSEEIQKSLLTINDLIRLYLKLAAKNILQINETNFAAFRTQIPRIVVPFSTGIIDIDNHPGNLVIVDTPGPNEAGMCKQLQEIVTKELRRADVTFVVFNYTTLKTESDATILAEVHELRKIRGDNNRLYAIVNKVDQRRSGDMSKGDVRKFISTNYGIEEQSLTNKNDRRIFEVKACFGLIAKRFLRTQAQLKENFGALQAQARQIVDDLGSALYNFNWETMKEEITIEKLHKGAIDMWSKSGLDELLQTAITTLMNSSLVLLIQSSLSKCQRIDRELIECLKQRLSVLDGNTDKLNVEIRELTNEMNSITTIEPEQFLNLSTYLSSLNEEFKLIESFTSNDVKEQVSQWLGEHNPHPKSASRAGQLASGLVLGGATTAACITGAMALAATSGLALLGVAAYHWHSDTKSKHVIVCAENEEVKEFNDEIVKLVRKVFDKNFTKIRERIDISWKLLSDNLCNSIIVKASEILKRAEQVVNEPFEMKQHESQTIDILFDKELHKKISIEKRYDLRPSVACGPSHPSVKYSYFIPHQDIVKICNELIEEQWGHMETHIKDWYTTELRTSFSDYINQLKEYLDRYLNIMQSSLNDRNMDSTDQENLRQKLQLLINELRKDLRSLTAE